MKGHFLLPNGLIEYQTGTDPKTLLYPITSQNIMRITRMHAADNWNSLMFTSTNKTKRQINQCRTGIQKGPPRTITNDVSVPGTTPTNTPSRRSRSIPDPLSTQLQ
jgi:hypothetical protein